MNPPQADIVLVTHGLKAGGTERVMTTLANSWVKEGRRVCVLTLSDENTDFFPLDPKVRRIAVGMPGRSKTRFAGMFFSLLRIIRLRRVLAKIRPVVVISFLPVINILVLLARFGLGIRVVISERSDPVRKLLEWPWEKLRQNLYRLADAVTVNSRGAIGVLKNYVPEKKLFYVPNPVSHITIQEKNKRGTVLRILAVGRLAPPKAYDILLPAFAKVAFRIPEWQLDIVGDGHLKKELLTQAENLGISDRINWHGLVDDPTVHYRAADIFILPSRFEGTPNVLLEAMSHGLPVIVTDASPGPLEYVEHEKTGLVVPVDDAIALSAALESLICDKNLRKKLGKEARKCLGGCELSRVMGIWDSVFEQLNVDKKNF